MFLSAPMENLRFAMDYCSFLKFKTPVRQNRDIAFNAAASVRAEWPARRGV
jgi:hypothetical protein